MIDPLRADPATMGNLLSGRFAATPDPSRARLDLVRRVLLDDGYFTTEQLGEDLAPRLAERFEAYRQQLAGLRDQVARVEERHRPAPSTEQQWCERHALLGMFRGISFSGRDCGCGPQPTAVCSNPGCGAWPCADHLALHGETKETCTHA